MGGHKEREASPPEEDERRNHPKDRKSDEGGGLVSGTDRRLVCGEGLPYGIEIQHLRVHPQGQGTRRGLVQALPVSAETQKETRRETRAAQEQGGHREAPRGS